MEQLNNNEYNILVVEDDKEIRDGIEIFLKSQGYHVYKAADGVEGLEVIERETIHLAIVDIMMPRMDGVTMTIKLREHHEFPVIMLSAKSEETDKVIGLNIGADDYIVKPFEPVEVVARINAHLRREEKTAENVNESDNNEIVVDNISINMEKYEVKLDGKLVTDLKPKEIQLLYFFLTNKNQVFTREQLLDKVWGYEYFGGTRTVDVHIKSVREKLYSKNNKWEIKTIWNVGYKFEVK